MRMILTALAIAALAAPGGARDRNIVPEATLAGKPQSCISIRNIRQSHVRTDKVIDFEMAGGQTYRSVMPQSCPSLAFEDRFTYTTSLSVLCSTDIITVLYASPELSRGASCGLGEFQPVKLVKPARR